MNNKDKKPKRSIADALFNDKPIENIIEKITEPNIKKNNKIAPSLNSIKKSKGKEKTIVKPSNILDIIGKDVSIDKKSLIHIDANTHKKIKLLSSITNINMYVILENILNDFLNSREKEIKELLKNKF
ncbi:hypothetical protein G1K66_12915 [Tenacibaculum finnmarkense]|nr:hypothetical protein [Tenacibaculum finnmarkense]MBE7649033.1 hypothetical protein [Tenacibaculum finnmarkense genomovar ulcerans]MCG8814155.1 hypothetical protein [Tenacibaculum finnmarkense]